MYTTQLALEYRYLCDQGVSYRAVFLFNSAAMNHSHTSIKWSKKIHEFSNEKKIIKKNAPRNASETRDHNGIYSLLKIWYHILKKWFGYINKIFDRLTIKKLQLYIEQVREKVISYKFQTLINDICAVLINDLFSLFS